MRHNSILIQNTHCPSTRRTGSNVSYVQKLCAKETALTRI
jgi:hypothetical protein